MLILSLDTALGGIGVSLQRGGVEIAGHADPAQGDQAAQLMPVIERVMAEGGARYADLAGFAVTVGPGGFTGVRIGLATARGLAFAAKKPLLGVTTLELLAEACPDRPLLALLPAGRGMFYARLFADSALSEPVLLGETEINALVSAKTVLSCPPGDWTERLPKLASLLVHDIAANACLLGRIAHRRGFENAPEALPLYIRPPDAKPQTPLLA